MGPRAVLDYTILYHTTTTTTTTTSSRGSDYIYIYILRINLCN